MKTRANGQIAPWLSGATPRPESRRGRPHTREALPPPHHGQRSPVPTGWPGCWYYNSKALVAGVTFFQQIWSCDFDQGGARFSWGPPGRGVEPPGLAPWRPSGRALRALAARRRLPLRAVRAPGPGGLERGGGPCQWAVKTSNLWPPRSAPAGTISAFPLAGRRRAAPRARRGRAPGARPALKGPLTIPADP